MIPNFNNIVVFDYNCRENNTVLLLNNTKYSSTEHHVELSFDYSNVNYLFFITLSNIINSSFRSKGALEYKKDIRIVTPTSYITLYNAWLSELNYANEDITGICLQYDHIEYNFDTDIFNNYAPYIRNYKLQKIKKKMKK
jgi:hypothetical protein